MKKLLILTMLPLLFVNCNEDYYEGDQRIIIEGNVRYNNSPLQNAEVRIYPVYNVTPTTNIISELTNYHTDSYSDEGFIISKTTTNGEGKISMSIPRNINTSVYAIRLSKGYDTKYYGYISKYNTQNYYVNLGTLTY